MLSACRGSGRAHRFPRAESRLLQLCHCHKDIQIAALMHPLEVHVRGVLEPLLSTHHFVT